MNDGTAPLDMTEVRFAGFWIRLNAFAIDSIYILLIVVVVVMVLLIVAAIIGEDEFFGGSGGTMRNIAIAYYLFLLALIVVPIFYFTFHTSKHQTTPGKRGSGLRVTTVEGGQVTLLRALARTFAYLASLLPALIGFVLIGRTREKTGLHDLICGTRVVYDPSDKRAKTSISQKWGGVIFIVVLVFLFILSLFGL